MKIAVFGKGKTGAKVIEKLEFLNIKYTIFDSVFLPTKENLKDIDIIICFVPGHVFEKFIPMFLESKKKLIIGSTGFSWPKHIDEQLKSLQIAWIYSSNFSMGMAIVKNIIELISKAESLLENANYSIHEVHHIHKLDSPSGTALSWKKWLNKEIEITSDRTGEVLGYHELKVSTESETLTVSHDVKDRMIFADGAIYAARNIMNAPNGLINFFDFIKDNLNK